LARPMEQTAGRSYDTKAEEDSDTNFEMGTYVHCPPQDKTYSTVGTGYWTTGLFGCCRDVPICCYGFWCPCAVAGENIELVSEGQTGCGLAGFIFCVLDGHPLTSCCTCAYTFPYRSKLRQKFDLPKTCSLVGLELPPLLDDCLVHTFCRPCALCQEARELRERGWKPSCSYGANVAVFEQRTHIPATPEMTRT